MHSFHFTLALDDIKKPFIAGLDTDKVRQRFLPLVEEFRMKAEDVKDKTFDTNIHSLCGFINSFKIHGAFLLKIYTPQYALRR